MTKFIQKLPFALIALFYLTIIFNSAVYSADGMSSPVEENVVTNSVIEDTTVQDNDSKENTVQQPMQEQAAVEEDLPKKTEDAPEEEPPIDLKQPPIFDDKRLLDGFAETYSKESLETLLAMIRDDTLDPYRMAAAVRAFKDTFSLEVFSKKKRVIEKILIRRLNRSDSAFVQVEIMHTLCRMDRYHFFNSMAPALILKMDHYNSTVNELAYTAIDDIIQAGNNRAREARVVFNTLRKVLFLSRKRLADVTEPEPRLKQKLDLLKWSIKVLGNQELKRLPKEVIGLL